VQPILQAALPKVGYNRNFPKDKVIHGPTSLLGADVHHPYMTQLIAHLDLLLRHGGQETITGLSLTGNLETTKLELGLPAWSPIWPGLQQLRQASDSKLDQRRLGRDNHYRHGHSPGGTHPEPRSAMTSRSILD
jgi:hypothetical protein